VTIVALCVDNTKYIFDQSVLGEIASLGNKTTFLQQVMETFTNDGA